MAIRTFHWDLDAAASFDGDQTIRDRADTQGATVEDADDAFKARLAAENRADPDRLARAGWVVTYPGRVLATGERNGYHDSDFYATVWDDDEARPVTVEYATTRFPTYQNSARVDADDQTIAKYAAWIQAQRAAAAAARADEEAKTPYPGKRVEVTGGRKHKGVTGEVVWRGEDLFARDYGLGRPYRVGIKPDGGGDTVFVPESYVQVDATVDA